MGLRLSKKKKVLFGRKDGRMEGAISHPIGNANNANGLARVLACNIVCVHAPQLTIWQGLSSFLAHHGVVLLLY